MGAEQKRHAAQPVPQYELPSSFPCGCMMVSQTRQVCAMWVPDLKVRPGAGAEAVEGVPSLRPERWGIPCTLCGSSKGVVLRCNAGHCTLPFHALCGRNAGYYLAMRPGPGKNQTTYRAYCAQHSESQRRKDASSSSLEPTEVPAAPLPGLQAALLNLVLSCSAMLTGGFHFVLNCAVMRHDLKHGQPSTSTYLHQCPKDHSCPVAIHTTTLWRGVHSSATVGGGCRQADVQVTGVAQELGRQNVCAVQGGSAARKVDMKRREKEEAAAAAALRSLAAKEAQQATLLTARLELESLRVLLERIGRRERIKMQGARLPAQFFPRLPYACCSLVVGKFTDGGVSCEVLQCWLVLWATPSLIA